MADHSAGFRGNLQIHHLWQHKTDTIIDVILMDTDTKSYIFYSVNNIIEIQENLKKKPIALSGSMETLHPVCGLF